MPKNTTPSMVTRALLHLSERRRRGVAKWRRLAVTELQESLKAINPECRRRRSEPEWRTSRAVIARCNSAFEVPFYLFQGECDVITLTSLATEYFDEVQAPTKELALITDAGHFAAFTQPDRFLAELLTRVRLLASAASPLFTRKA